MLSLASIPDFSNLMGLVQACFAVVGMILAGRLILCGRGGFSLQLMAGWGALCLILTFWGIVSGLSLRIPTVAFAIFALGGVRAGDWRKDWADAWRVLAMALPLLAATADMQLSQIDVFAVMVPNSAYLSDYGVFPSMVGPEAHSDVPLAPYNKEFVSLLGGMMGGGYAATAPSQFAVLLHLAAALLLARLVAGDKAVPSWGAAALGLALSTLFDPAFAPRVAFSGMGEPHLAITLLFAGWLAMRAMTEVAEGRTWPSVLLPLMLVLAVLVNIKQQGVGLLLAFLGGLLVAAALDQRVGLRTGLRIFGLCALPALVLYLSWRGYVLLRFPGGELKPLPRDEWALANLLEILKGVGGVIISKQYYFGCVAAVLGLATLRPGFLSDRAMAVLRMTAVTFILYAAFLILTYVVHFRAEHSFFRYNSHLSLLVVLGLVLAGCDYLASRPPIRHLVFLGRAVVVIMLVAPVAGIHLLRYDLDRPQPQLRAAARVLAQEISDGERIAVILSNDNGMSAIAFDSLLRFAPPRRSLVDMTISVTADPAVFARAVAEGRRLVFLSCTNDTGLADLPPDAAVLFAWSDGVWKPVRSWTYPSVPPKRWWNWAGYLASEPFCLKSR